MVHSALFCNFGRRVVRRLGLAVQVTDRKQLKRKKERMLTNIKQRELEIEICVVCVCGLYICQSRPVACRMLGGLGAIIYHPWGYPRSESATGCGRNSLHCHLRRVRQEKEVIVLFESHSPKENSP